MQITFELHELSEADVRGLHQLLDMHLKNIGVATPLPRIDEAPQPAVGQNTGSAQPGAVPSLGDAAVTGDATQAAATAASPAPVTDAPPKRGPGRPRKTVEAPAPAPAFNPNSMETQVIPREVIDAAIAEAAAAKAAPIGADDLRAALQKLTEAKGIPAGIELLKTYGCQRISEMAAKDQDVQAQFVAQCGVA